MLAPTGLLGEALGRGCWVSQGRAGPGQRGLKCKAKGLRLKFSGTREPLMTSEPVSDLSVNS